MFKVRVFNSKKGAKCHALVCDLGYRVAYVSFDLNLCAELLKMSISEAYSLANGDYNLN